MTSDSNARMLDLDSQIQLLSRIQFLTRFSSNLIQVTGGDGAGKTWLAQRYLEHWAPDSNQALLTCYPTQTASQHRSILLKQLVAKPLFNDQDPLVQSLERMLEGNRCNVLLVIDDAQLLSPTMIAELWALVLKAQNEPLWQINILLLSQPGRLNKYLDQASHGQGQVPLELEISDLTEQEAQSFVEVMLSGDQLDANGRRALKEKAATTAARPGALMQLDHTESKDMTNSSSRILSPAALLVVLLAVVGAGLVFWLFPADDSTTAVAVQTDNAPAVDEPAASLKTGRFDETEQVEADQRDPVTETVKSVTPQDEINDDSHALPPELSLEGLTVGRKDDNKRVVVPSQVVDAMISEQELGGSGEQAIAQQELPNETAMTALTDTLVKTAEPAAVSTTEPEAQPVEAKPTNVLGSELKAIDSRHYTLQLAALKSLSAAKQFVTEHDISEIATLYETRRNGEPWFIVITGDYQDIVTARRAETQLPGGVQAVQPWVKSYAQIHREIDRVK